MESTYEGLLAGLAEAGVQFMTVGGIACALNGHVRATEDVDILVRRSDPNLRLLLATLLRFGEGHARELTLADFPDEEGAVRVIEEFPLDIFVRMGGRSFDDLRSHVQLWPSGPTAIPFLGLEGLLLLKRQSMREKDRIDVLALTALLEGRG
jgi:hypothetical protein